MNTIKTFIDADALTGLALTRESLDIASLMRKQGMEFVTSDSMVQEILRTGCSSRRTLIARLALDLLHNSPILAPLSQQIRWSSIDFAEGEVAFRPYRTAKEDWVKRKLIEADTVTEEDLDELGKIRKHEVDAWDTMHAEGRPYLQDLLSQNSRDLPPIRDWLKRIESDFVGSLVNGIVASEARPKITGNERGFVEWNPILRCYLEQLLLAIYRHGIEHPNAASKKGPKWMDYSHGAFAGLVDVFVTNDKRFGTALEQHSSLFPKWQYSVYRQSEFVDMLRCEKGFENGLVHKAVLTLPPRE